MLFSSSPEYVIHSAKDELDYVQYNESDGETDEEPMADARPRGGFDDEDQKVDVGAEDHCTEEVASGGEHDDLLFLQWVVTEPEDLEESE